MAVVEQAIFAAGCFWGVQDYFDQVPGVLSTEVGYTGGTTDKPTYEQVCTGSTGHAEAILINFDPSSVSYSTLLKHFFRLHDPTQYMRQGPDVGSQYRSAIFYTSQSQLSIGKSFIKDLQPDYDNKIVTELAKFEVFYPAEDYHQKFTLKTGRGGCHIEFKSI